MNLQTIKPSSIAKITVDTTVQEKNIGFPTDSKLLNETEGDACSALGADDEVVIGAGIDCMGEFA